MREDDRFIPFFEAYKDDFFESMEDVKMYLKNSNLEYKNTQQKLHNILDNNINIQKIFDEADIENGLSKEECKMLSKIIILNYKLQLMIQAEICRVIHLESTSSPHTVHLSHAKLFKIQCKYTGNFLNTKGFSLFLLKFHNYREFHSPSGYKMI